jgi:hypothetical protein
MLGEIPTLIVAINDFLFFLIHYPIWVKLCMRDLNVLILSICECCENRDKKAVTVRPYDILEIVNTFVKSVH